MIAVRGNRFSPGIMRGPEFRSAPETINRWRPRAAAIGVTLVLMLHIVSAAFQYRLLQPGENLTVLLPRAPIASPPRALELMRFFFSKELLPLMLILFISLIVVVGFRATIEKRVQN